MSSGLRPDEWRRKAMSYLNFFARFRRDQSGAVTVDWVVLTAALVGIAVALVSTISDGLDTASTAIAQELTSVITD